jgi:type IV secretion system protein VirD4
VKGENVAVTARRRRELGQTVHVIDPFGVTKGQRHGFNPLAWLDLNSPEVVSDASVLVDLLVVRSTGHVDPHWDESAAHLLQGLMLYVAMRPNPAERHLGTVRRLLTQPEGRLIALLEELGEDEAIAFGVLARSANAFLGKADRERSSVLSTAQRHTAFLDDPRVVETLKGELDFGSLKHSAADGADQEESEQPRTWRVRDSGAHQD